jgi:hypothetical protein
VVESSPSLGPPAIAVAAAGRSEHASTSTFTNSIDQILNWLYRTHTVVHVDSLQRIYLVGGVAGSSNGRTELVCGLAYFNLINATWSTASLLPCSDTANTNA